MSAYSKSSNNAIVVPNFSGVLSDEQYNSLSPSSYTLDNAISEYTNIKSKIEKAIETFSRDYKSSSEKIEENLGTEFFSIDDKPLGIVYAEEEIKQKNQIIQIITDELENLGKSMVAINEKLIEVDEALLTMNENYHTRKEIIEEERKKYSRHLQQEPQPINHLDNDSYTTAHETWNQQLESLIKTIDGLQEKLEEDCLNTKNSINISWYCEENR